MCTLDNIFATLPFFVIFYLLKKLIVSLIYVDYKLQWNYLCVRNMFFMSLLSSILKYILKKKRRRRSIQSINGRSKCICNNLLSSFSSFGFPSNHTVFFMSLFFDHPSVKIFIFSTIGILSRVYFEHHTLTEVIESIMISIVIRDFLQYQSTRIFRIEETALNTFIKTAKIIIEQNKFFS